MMSIPQMLRCVRASRALQRYLDGEADDLTAARVAEHLDECRRCGLQARTYEAIKRSVATGSRDVDDLAVHRLRAFARSLPGQDGAGTSRPAPEPR